MGNRFITPNGELCLGKYLRIHLLLLPLGAAAYWGNYFGLFAISWVSALCHETAHILAGKRLGVPIAGVSLLPFGVCARLSQPVIKIPSHEILMVLAGPLSNLILAALFWVLGQQFPSDLAQYGTAANLAMFCLNLLPCLPLDGGRILRACLTLGSDALTAWRTTLRISRAVSVCLLAGAVLLLLTSQFNFSLILIGVFLLGNLCGEQKSISQQALREILYYKEKLEREQLNRHQYTHRLCRPAGPQASAPAVLSPLLYHTGGRRPAKGGQSPHRKPNSQCSSAPEHPHHIG